MLRVVDCYELLFTKESISDAFSYEKFIKENVCGRSDLRILGIYLISAEDVKFDINLLYFMVNNQEIRPPSVLLHFDLKATHTNPFNFY